MKISLVKLDVTAAAVKAVCTIDAADTLPA